MQKRDPLLICNFDEIDEKMLTFKLSAEQRARIQKGEEVVFRKSTQHYKASGYWQLIARAEVNRLNPATGKRRAVAIGTKLIGIIREDENNQKWVYKTQPKRKGSTAKPVPKASQKAEIKVAAASVEEFVAEKLEFEPDSVVSKKVPIELFLVVALLSSCRGLSDATSVAAYWNSNLDTLRTLYPELDLEEISHDTARRIYISLTEKCIRNLVKGFYDWLPKESSQADRRHVAIDGQACRASRHVETDRRMMILNAVDVTAGKLCFSHMMIDTKSHEPRYAPVLLDELDIHGATVSFDALNTTPKIAEAIISGGGFYLLAVKSNQPKLYEAVVAQFDKALAENPDLGAMSPRKWAHGRMNSRGYGVLPAANLPETLLDKWPGLREGCIIKTQTWAWRKKKDGHWDDPTETRYFVTCHPYADGSIADWLSTCVRGHWGVESFHNSIDLLWRQDQMQCKYPAYLRARTSLAKMAHNSLMIMQKIDQEERGLTKPRSEKQLSHEVAPTLEHGLHWLRKILARKDAPAEA